jgi:hypothetical protein
MGSGTLSMDCNHDVVRGLPCLFIHQERQRIEHTKHCFLLHAGFLDDLLFNPENGGDMLLRNVS